MNLNLLRNKFVLALAFMSAGAICSFAQVETTVVKVTENTFVSQQDPATVKNGETDMGVAIDATNGDSRETYLKFDISSLIGKGGLVSANLAITAAVKAEAPWTPIPNFFLNVYGCTKDWSAADLTWENKVESDPTLIAEADIMEFATYVIKGTEADTTTIKKYIEEAMKNHLQFVSFVFKGKEETAGSRIWISSNTWLGATLNVVQDYSLDEPGAIENYVTSITITGEGNANTISVDNGTLQMNASVLPVDADNKTINWSVTEGTGKAKISSTGLLTAIKDGTVTVTAAASDGSDISKNAVITISGQNYSYDDRNYVINGSFALDGDLASPWGGSATVVGGIAESDPPQAYDNVWDYGFGQVLHVPYADKDLNYIFTFKAWADEARPINVDFEDNSENGWVRYGTSSDPQSNGKSDWTFDVTTTPTVYTLHVIFSGMLENTTQNMNFWLGKADAKVYVDSVALMTEADFALKAPTVLANSLKVYPNPVGSGNELTVSLATPNAKVAIYNSLGQKMMEKVATGNVAKFDVNNLQRGIYVVKLNDGSFQKFIK